MRSRVENSGSGGRSSPSSERRRGGDRVFLAKDRLKCLFFRARATHAFLQDFCAFGGVYRLRRRHKGDMMPLSPPNSIMATIKARRQANGTETVRQSHARRAHPLVYRDIRDCLQVAAK